jgi:putative endonuclease
VTQRRLQLGRDGEQQAAVEYQRRGYRVLERNWRVREGEVDLIVGRSGVLVFCEVKSRSSDRFGSPAEAVDWRKQQQVRSVARLYLAGATGGIPSSIRFDVAAITAGRLTIIENAF